MSKRYYIDVTIDQGYFVADSEEEAYAKAKQCLADFGAEFHIYDVEDEEVAQ